MQIASISTFLTLLVGYPIAYAMARAPEEWRPTLMMLVILPFWTSFPDPGLCVDGHSCDEGFLNQFLLWIGVISEPLTILNTNTAVYIGIVYTYLPFMILPIYAALDKMDASLLEAAEDLGLFADASVLAGHDAAVANRRDCRVFPGVHPGAGRVRDPVAVGRVGHADDRQGAVGGVLSQPRLAGGSRRGGDPAADPDHPDHLVPAQPAETAEAEQ